MLCSTVFNLAGDLDALAFFRGLQTLIAHGNHCARGIENRFGLVETDIQKLNQIIDGGIRQAIDIRDSVLSQGIRLLRSDTFDRGQRH